MTDVSTRTAGPIALVGSGEFLPQMVDVDRFLLTGRPPRAAFLPTAAGEEGAASVNRWLKLGTDHYTAMGIEPVAIPVLNADDANRADLAALIDDVGLIYLSGGNPGYIAKSLRNSLVWDAIVRAWLNGAALAGCSAGAMVLTASAPDVRGGRRVSSEPATNLARLEQDHPQRLRVRAQMTVSRETHDEASIHRVTRCEEEVKSLPSEQLNPPVKSKSFRRNMLHHPREFRL